MKKIWSIILALLIIMSSFAVFAESDEVVSVRKYQNEINFFVDAGIFDFDFYDEDPVTRVEYAVMLVRLLNAEDALPSYAQSSFSDVSVDNPNHDYIEFLKESGVIKGNSDNTFRPDDELTFNEAVTCLVRLLGYSTKADYTGGYTSGYNKAAIDLGLLRGVDTSMCEDYMAAGPLAQMFYNALDKEIINSYNIKGTNVSIIGSTGMTILELLDYKKETGIVNAVENINLYGVVSDKLDSMVVEINSQKYKITASSVKKLLGYEVEFFSQKKDGDTYPTLISVKKKNSSAKEITLYNDDIKKVSSTTVTYRDKEKDKDVTLKLSAPVILDNGTPVSTMSSSIVPKNGFMRMIANDGKNYDTVLIYDFETFMIKSIREETLMFEYGAKTSWGNKSSLDLSKIPYSIYTEEDGYDDIESLSVKDVVMIAYGRSGVYIYPSSVTMMGEITATTSKNVMEYYINGTYYEVNPDFQKLIDNKADGTKELELNMYTTFYFDYMGKIYGTSEIGSEFEYGYIFALSKQGVFEKDVQIKVLCEYFSGIGVFKLDKDVYLNGTKKSAEDAYTALEALKNDTSKSPVFKFKYNKNEEITEIVTTTVIENSPNKIGDDKIVLSAPKADKIWQASYSYYTDYGSQLGPIYADSTLTFKVNENSTEEKYYSTGACKRLMPNTDNKGVTVACYDVNEYGVPGLVVYYDTSGGSSVKFDSDIYFVNYTYYGLAENGDSVIGIGVTDKNGSKRKILTDGSTETANVCKNLNEGDFIQVSTNSQNVAEGVEKVFSYNMTAPELEENFKTNGVFSKRMASKGQAGNFALYSTVKGVKDCSLGTVIRFAESVKPDGSRGACDYRLLGNKKIMVYDGNEAYLASPSELEEGDIMFTFGVTETYYQIIVIRNATFLGQKFIYRAS